MNPPADQATATASGETHHGGPDDSRRISTVLGVLFGLAGMGSSSAALALPLIGTDLDVSLGTATWTISLYVLMLAVTTAVYGRVSDLVGTRLPLLLGIGLMTAGALMAALAPSLGVLLVARMLQGAGAAAVPTLGVAIVSGRYDGEVRGLALGRLAGVAAAVSCLGPLAGGLVEHALGWRAVMALPILGVLVVPLLWRALSREGSGARLDVVGAVLVAGTAGGAVLLVQSPSTGVLVAVAGVVLMAVGLPAVTLRVRRRPHGFLPREVASNPRLVRCGVAAAAVPASWFALLVAVPAALSAQGWEAWQVGVLLLPSALVAVAMPRGAGALLRRQGPERTLVLAAAVSLLALALCAAGTALVSPVLLVVSVMGVTAGFGLGQPALMAAAGDAVREEVRGVALGIATLVFLAGGSIGSAVVGGLGDVVGLPLSIVVLGAFPLLGLAVVRPLVGQVPPPSQPSSPS